MDTIIDPTFIKLAIGLASAVAYLVREMGKREHVRALAEQQRLQEGRDMHRQLMTTIAGMQRGYEKLEAWSQDHERADRIRFRRLERHLQSVLPPEQRMMGGLR